jgi:hypothetical protein
LFWQRVAAEAAGNLRDERVDEAIHYALRQGSTDFDSVKNWYMERFFVSEIEARLRRFTSLRRLDKQSMKDYMEVLRQRNRLIQKSRRLTMVELADKLYTSKIQDGPWTSQELIIFEKIPVLKAEAVSRGTEFDQNNWDSVYAEARRLATEQKSEEKSQDAKPDKKRKKVPQKKKSTDTNDDGEGNAKKPRSSWYCGFCKKQTDHTWKTCPIRKKADLPKVGTFSKDGKTFQGKSYVTTFKKPMPKAQQRAFAMSAEDLMTDLPDAENNQEEK